MRKLTIALTAMTVISLGGCTMPMHVDVHNEGKLVEVIKATTTGLECLNRGTYDCYIRREGDSAPIWKTGKIYVDKQVLFSFDEEGK